MNRKGLVLWLLWHYSYTTQDYIRFQQCTVNIEAKRVLCLCTVGGPSPCQQCMIH